MTKRKRGDRSSNLLNSLDLVVLRTLKNQKEDIGILDVCELIGMSHRALKGHIRHLFTIKLISKGKPQKYGKVPLKITNDGEKILEIFDRNLK